MKHKRIVTSYRHREAVRARLMAMHIQYHDYLVGQLIEVEEESGTVH